MSLLKAMRSLREVLRLTVLRKAPRVPVSKTIPRETHTENQAPSQSLITLTFRNRFLRSILSRSASFMKPFFAPLRARNGGVNRLRRVPFISLVGISLGMDMDSLSESYTENTMKAVREVFKDYQWEPNQLNSSPTCLDDLDINESSVIGRGCEGAVFEARLKNDSSNCNASSSDSDDTEVENYNLAVKAVFNYGAESNATSILRELNREVVPLQSSGSPSNEVGEFIENSMARLPPHPNVVDMHCVFVDDMLVTEQGKKEFPAAMPQRINPDGCFGRNKTLYLVMRKCTTRLSDFLPRDIPMSTRCLLLTQLLEAVAHINSNGIAHRDIKMDNVLVDLSQNNGCPHLQICDFGCCLAEENKNLVVPYVSNDVNVGGNSWLMAPEISCAKPGKGAVLDFRKSDLWACGALAYSVLGVDNPFYPNSKKQLSSRSYTEDELPALPEKVPVAIKRLVKCLLDRNPHKRPSASVAALVALIASWELTDGLKNKRPTHRVISTKCNKMSRYVNYRHKQRQKMEMLLGKTFDLIKKMTANAAVLKQDVVEVLNFLCLSRMTLTEFHQALKFF